jgi:hypothetical protein
MEIAALGAVRYLLPLLSTKISPARWNARQTLMNLSMSSALLPHLQLYNVPAYIHGANIPQKVREPTASLKAWPLSGT